MSRDTDNLSESIENAQVTKEAPLSRLWPIAAVVAVVCAAAGMGKASGYLPVPVDLAWLVGAMIVAGLLALTGAARVSAAIGRSHEGDGSF